MKMKINIDIIDYKHIDIYIYIDIIDIYIDIIDIIDID